MSWVTEADALKYTGETIAPEDLEKASAVITIYAGVTEDQPTASIGARDRLWLAMATAYQAAWMPSKPGLLTQRESHADTSTDGTRVARESDSQIMLAPLAARTLKNLSWMGTRSTLIPSAVPAPRSDFLNEAYDGAAGWKLRSIQ